MIVIKGGVTAPKGFLANGVRAGIKESGRPDLALLYSEVPAVAAGAFTANRFQASPVRVSKLHLRNSFHEAIIVNSGNANCINGKTGDRNAMRMAEYIAKTMALKAREVLVASTGIIGKPLPIEKIEKAIPSLISELSEKNGKKFSGAIMTTDTVAKEFALKTRLGASYVTLGGSCKGVGMICPDMKTEKHATLLSFLTTDAAISKRMLEAALEEAIADSFNMVSVDGDMSTNDTCFILANGLADNKKIEAKNGHYKEFVKALRFLCAELAKMIARDGEGATKFVEIEVRGARSAKDAKTVARKVSNSNLLKCCIYGQDPNWGRVVAACGASGVDFDPAKVDVYLGGIKALAGGAVSSGYDKAAAARLFKDKDIKITIDLNSGKARTIAWTCDLSKEYVAINSEYST